ARRLCSVAVSVAARSAWRVARAGPTSSITIATDLVTRVSISSGCRNRARTSIRGHSATHSVQCNAPSVSRRPQYSSRAVGVAVWGVLQLALALAVPPGVIARADRGSDASAGEQAGDADRGLVEQFDQLADLGGEHRERTQITSAHAGDRTPRS